MPLTADQSAAASFLLESEFAWKPRNEWADNAAKEISTQGITEHRKGQLDRFPEQAKILRQSGYHDQAKVLEDHHASETERLAKEKAAAPPPPAPTPWVSQVTNTTPVPGYVGPLLKSERRKAVLAFIRHPNAKSLVDAHGVNSPGLDAKEALTRAEAAFEAYHAAQPQKPITAQPQAQSAVPEQPKVRTKGGVPKFSEPERVKAGLNSTEAIARKMGLLVGDSKSVERAKQAAAHSAAIRGGRTIPADLVDKVAANLEAHGYNQAAAAARGQAVAVQAQPQAPVATASAPKPIGPYVPKPGKGEPYIPFRDAMDRFWRHPDAKPLLHAMGANDDSLPRDERMRRGEAAYEKFHGIKSGRSQQTQQSGQADPPPLKISNDDLANAKTRKPPAYEIQDKDIVHPPSRFSALVDAAKNGRLKDHLENGLGNFFDKFERVGNKALRKIGIPAGDEEQESAPAQQAAPRGQSGQRKYRYSALDDNGLELNHEVNAASREEALGKAKALGHFVTKGHNFSRPQVEAINWLLSTEFARTVARGQKSFDFDADMKPSIPDEEPENGSTKQPRLFGDIPKKHRHEARTLSRLHGGREVRRTSSGGWQVRAPKGGKKSEVNGVFYPGGQFMPIHGLKGDNPKSDTKEMQLPFDAPKEQSPKQATEDAANPQYAAKGNEVFDANGVRHGAFRNEEKAKAAADEWNLNGKPGSKPKPEIKTASPTDMFPSLADDSPVAELKKITDEHMAEHVKPAENPQPVEPKTEEPNWEKLKDVAGGDDPEAPSADDDDYGSVKDFGEKIGGARKDTATALGKRTKGAAKDTRPGWMKRYGTFRVGSGKHEGKWTVVDLKSGRSPLRDVVTDTQEQAEFLIPIAEVGRKHDVRNIAKPGQDANWAIQRDVDVRKKPIIKDGFETQQDAMKYMIENATQILSIPTRITENIHPELEQIVREGDSHRPGGKHATEEDYKKFGFRGVEFGKWVKQDEGRHILDHAYDALTDMADILGVPQKALSLDGELAVGFGSRGKGNSGWGGASRAHYERNYGVINMTKIKGAGSLAHEWMHAFDHWLGRKSGKASSQKIVNDNDDDVFKTGGLDRSADYVSHGFSRKKPEGFRQEVTDAFNSVMDAVTSREMKYKEDSSLHEKRHAKRSEELKNQLDQYRTAMTKDYSKEKYQAYKGKRGLPASPEVMKQIDEISAKLLAGEYGEDVRHGESSGDTPANRAKWGHSMPANVAKLADLHKELRGNKGYSATAGQLHGIIADIKTAAMMHRTGLAAVKDAAEQKEKTGKVRSEFFSHAERMDSGQKADYWSTKHELAARAFESYIYDKIKAKGHRSDYLAYEKHNDLPEYRMFGVKPYPEGEERSKINAAFDHLFSVVSKHELSGEHRSAVTKAPRGEGDSKSWDEWFKRTGESHRIDGISDHIKGKTGVMRVAVKGGIPGKSWFFRMPSGTTIEEFEKKVRSENKTGRFFVVKDGEQHFSRDFLQQTGEQTGFGTALAFLVENDFARKPVAPAAGQKSLFDDDGGSAVATAGDWKPPVAASKPKQRAFGWDESKVSRESTAHDNKRPGEFAPKHEPQPEKQPDPEPEPKQESAPSPVAEMFPSLAGEESTAGLSTKSAMPVLKAAPAAEPDVSAAGDESFNPEKHGGYQPLLQLAQDIRDGKTSLDQYKSQHAFYRKHSAEFLADLNKRFNATQMKNIAGNFGDFSANRNTKEKNAQSIHQKLMTNAFLLSGGLQIDYMGGESYDSALDKHVGKQTGESLAAYQQKKAESAKEATKQEETKAAGIEDPKTLEDYRNVLRHYGGYDKMPEAMQAAFDEFAATRRRETATQSKAKVVGFSGGTAATGATSIVEGHHQKRNAPTYTVTVENHLGDGWSEALSRAKQLGGSYVNGRIAKAYNATAGFQFFNKADAEKFQKSLGGEEVDRSDRLDEKNIARMDNASERLAALAESTKRKAEEKLNAPRQTNTHRRAEMAAGAQSQARSEAAKAETMQRISEGLAEGSLKHLGGIRARTHVDTLDSLLHSAKLNAWRDSGSNSQDSYEEMRERDATPADIAKAKYPYPKIWDHELAEHLTELSQIPGLKNIARDLKKSTEKSPYKKKIGKISINGGEAKTADQLSEIPLARGLIKDKAVRIHVSQDPALLKGRHSVAYTADGGKTWGTTQDIAVSAAVRGEVDGTSKLDLIDPPRHEQVEIKDPETIANIQKAIKVLKRKSNPRLRSVAEALGMHMEDYNRLHGMDITTPMELRAALREYAPLKKRQDKEDPVKAAERSLVGRKIAGFFPTPRPAIDRMLAAADIEPGMSVLEPSAGKGDILDAIREQHPEAKPIGIETVHELRNLIGMKGHEMHEDSDFLQHHGSYDRIVMNAPYENRQDVEHTKHAYKNLKPGGRLVSLMSAGAFGGSSKKDQEFRDWLDEHGAEVEDMPDGSFNGPDAFRKTGVSTRMVVMNKPSHESEQFSRDIRSAYQVFSASVAG